MANTTVCTDTSEAVELFQPQGLHLKPIAKVNICVQLPQLKVAGKTISNWEVMEKLKHMVRPEVFLTLKIFKSTIEFIRLEGEIENKSKLHSVILKLDGKTIKLSGFTEILKVRAAEAKVNFPSRHDWDSYFRDAKNMNEMRPGERPDTVHLKDLPTRWFAARHSDKDSEKDLKPSESVIRKVFGTFGEIRCIDVPMLDPYRKEICANLKKSTIQTFSYGQDLTFECFVQYMDYISFVKAMDSLRGMKLLYKGEDKALTSIIKVDFDKTKHLSEKNIRRRRIEREKLESLERERLERARREREEEERKREEERRKKEEEERERERKRQEKLQRKEERRKEREEKRRQKKIEKKQREEEERMQYKIALEERRLLIAQRKLESLRILSELFERIKAIRVKKYLEQKEKELEEERKQQLLAEEKRRVEEERKKAEEKQLKKQKLQQQEQELRDKILKNFKAKEEQLQEKQREELRKKLAGTRKLKSAVIMNKAVDSALKRQRKDGGTDSEEKDDDDDDEEDKEKKTASGKPAKPLKKKGSGPVTKRIIIRRTVATSSKPPAVKKPESSVKAKPKHKSSESEPTESSDNEDKRKVMDSAESHDSSGDERTGSSSVMERVLKANRMRAWREPGDGLDSPPHSEPSRGRGRFRAGARGGWTKKVETRRDRERSEGNKQSGSRERSRSRGSSQSRDRSRSRERSRSRGRSRSRERSRSRHRTRSRERSQSRERRERSGSSSGERDYEKRSHSRRGGHVPQMVPGPGGVMMPLPHGPHPMFLPPPPFHMQFGPFRGRARGPRGMLPMGIRGGSRGMRGMRLPPPPLGMRGGLHVFNKSYLRKYNQFLGMANQMRDMTGRYAQPLQVAPPAHFRRRDDDDDDDEPRSRKHGRHHRRHRRSSDRSRSRHRSRSSGRHRSRSYDRTSSSSSRSRSRSRRRSRSKESSKSRERSRSREDRSRGHSSRERSSSVDEGSRKRSKDKSRDRSQSGQKSQSRDKSVSSNKEDRKSEDKKEVHETAEPETKAEI